MRAWQMRVPTLSWLVLGTSVVLGVALHLAWLYRFRLGYVTEWDESGYMAIALNDTNALRSDGLPGLLSAVEHQSSEAPLVPLVTVPMHLVFGSGIAQSLLILLIFFAVLVLATYGLARCVSTPGWAALAALSVAAMPGVTDYTRLYHFAVPAAALLTAALWAQLRSDGFERRNWSAVWGIFIGLMLLARTMTVAYLPGFALAAIVQVLARCGARRQRTINLGLGTVIAIAVVSVWYLQNGKGVASYLIHSGYGAQAASYGAGSSIMSWRFWTKELALMLDSLYLPLAGLIGLCFLAALFLHRPRPASERSWRTLLRSWANQDIFVLIVVVVEGYLVLTSSRNEGTAFSLPWLPALVVLAVVAAANVRLPSVRVVLAVLFVLVSMGDLLSKSGFVPLLATPRSVALPSVGQTTVTDGRGIIQLQVLAAGYPTGSPTTPLPRLQRQWLPFFHLVTGWIVHYADAHRQRPVVLFGSGDLLFNDTRIELAAALWYRRSLQGGFLKPYSGGNGAQSYRAQMSSARNNFLVTADRAPREDLLITRSTVEEAARSLNFIPVKAFTLPDGRRGWLWWRTNRT